jgi:class 3 adenylate cyclase/tetratricopeptide (TPR) repeat protein
MTFDEILAQTIELLQRDWRVSYRALKRRFSIDDEYVEDLKTEIIRAKRLAIDEDGAVLVWIGSPSQITTSSGLQLPEKGESGVTRATVSEGERRQLTVMFCDLVGSTPLSEQFDPEDLRDLILPYQHACSEVIARFNGHIAKYLGDGLLAYFGYPQAHEDDAQRAVRAALGIIAAMRRLNAGQGGLPVSLKVRLGIHTGLVVVSEMGGREFREQAAIVGETPNTADRLQEIAEPDSVVISGATYQLVRGLFDCEALGARALKGLSVPVQAYCVLRESEAQSRFDVAIQAGLTPLVGRENESAILNERWERAKAGEGQVVLLSGEPGIGKSRLLRAFMENSAAQRGQWLECHCSPYYQNTAHYPIIDVLQRLLGFESIDDASVKLSKLERALSKYDLPVTDYLPLLAPLFSLPVPEEYPRLKLTLEAQKEKTHLTIQSWLLSLAERGALVLIFEDLHWADPSTLELLGSLLDRVPTTKLLMVLTYRPEFSPPWPVRSHFVTIALTRLPRAQAEAIMGNVCRGKALPVQVLDQIISKTDGVPLFVEELTKTVLESELLREREDRYELVGPLPPLAIPSTLQNSLASRLDRLGSVREVAQLAATIGREFSHELLRAISPLDDAGLLRAMTVLVDAEVLYRRGVTPQAHYFFKHALIRDAAYESLLKSRRQQIHSRIALILQERFPDLASSQPELVAHHYTEAGLPAQAVPYWQKAGEQAFSRCAFRECITHLTKTLDLLPERAAGLGLDQIQLDELRCRILLTVGEAQHRLGQELKAQQTLMRAADVAQSLSSFELVCQAAWQLTWLGFSLNAAITPAIHLFEETLEKIGPEYSPLRAAILGGLANVLSTVGDERAVKYGREGAAVARRLGSTRALLMSLHGMCCALYSPESAGERLVYAEEMFELAKTADLPQLRLGDRSFTVGWAEEWLERALWWRIYSSLQLGDMRTIRKDLKDYGNVVQDSGFTLHSCMSKNFQACVASIEGRFGDCERLAHEAFAIGQTIDIESVAGVFGVQMFTLRREQGRLREVEPILRHFVETLQGANAWRPGLALIYSELGHTPEAAAEFERLAQRDFAEIPRDANWLGCMSYLAEICAFLGDATRAQTLYDLLLPFKAINVLVGENSACYGSASRYLGALATVMARWDDAERHFEDALAVNSAMGARPWLAHTQYQYARMLLTRDQLGDSEKAASLLKDALATARELGMRALEQRITSGSP